MKIKQFVPVLEYVKGLSKRGKHDFLRHATKEFLSIIAKLCHNVNSGNLDLTESQIKKLRRYKDDIQFMCKKNRSAAQRRPRRQVGGNFLAFYWPRG